MASKPKTTSKRTTIPQTRNPNPKPRTPKVEHYVPMSAQRVCPMCGGTLRAAHGRHIDPVRKVVLGYSNCIKCGNPALVEAPMNGYQEHEFCTHTIAVAEYQRISRR